MSSALIFKLTRRLLGLTDGRLITLDGNSQGYGLVDGRGDGPLRKSDTGNGFGRGDGNYYEGGGFGGGHNWGDVNGCGFGDGYGNGHGDGNG
jgi:hypothetical protein